MSGEKQAARDLVALYAKRVRLTHEMADSDSPAGGMARDILALGDALDAACADFRRTYYPRAGRVVVGLYSVMVVSPGGRRVRTAFDGFDEFAPGGTP